MVRFKLVQISLNLSISACACASRSLSVAIVLGEALTVLSIAGLGKIDGMHCVTASVAVLILTTWQDEAMGGRR